MNQASDRVPCPKCQASNFANSAVCWQCGEPLSGPTPPQVSNETPGGPAPPQVSNETPGGPVPPPPFQPAPGYEPPPPPVSDNSTLLIVLGFVSAALGVICCPVFPIVGIILGVIIQRRGNQLGTWIIITSALFLVAGLVFTGVVAAMVVNMMKQGGIPNPYNLPAPK